MKNSMRNHRGLPLLVAAAVSLQAAAPTLREISPRGAQRGKTFTLYLRGEGLVPNAQVKTTLPASFSRLTLSKDPMSESRPNSVLPFLVTLKPDTPTGFHPIRVTTPDGISNVLLFSVGDFPEIEELETKNPRQPNDFPEEAQRIMAPVVINGTLAGPDVDMYSFTAKAGQKLVFEVEARRAGSAVDPAIEILDASGREIAKNDDAPGLGVDSRVEVTFPKNGEYRVRVHDSKYSEQAQNFYRLKVGNYEYADGLFPLGWRRGEAPEITLLGGNLAKPLKIKQDLQSKSSTVPVRVPSSSSPPLMFALSDQTELLEPESAPGPVPLSENTIMNGRIGKPGEVDHYRVLVEPGQKWVFEVTAASLGTSRLDGILTVCNAAGKKLASADDGNGLDPVLFFTVPSSVSEVIVAVEDLLGRGGDTFTYRLQARRQHPDFVAEIATPFVNVPAGGTAQVVVNIQRRGYSGAIRLRIPDLPEGFHVAGGHVPAEAAAQNFNNDNAGRRGARSVLAITADPDVKPRSLDLRVVAEAETPEGPIRRFARGPGMITAVRGDKQKALTASWLEMDLPMAVTSPSPVTIVSPAPVVRFAQGFEYNLEYRVQRASTFKAPVKVNQQIAGAVGNLRILKGQNRNADTGSFLVNTNFATPFTTFDMILEAQTEIEGKPVTVSSPAIEIQVVPGYEILLTGGSATQVSPGGKARIEGKVRREPTFEGGAIRVRLEDLPDQIKCPEVEIPADQTAFVIACEAAPSANPGSFEIRVTSVAPETGRKAKQDYKIPDLAAKLVVTGTAQAAR